MANTSKLPFTIILVMMLVACGDVSDKPIIQENPDACPAVVYMSYTETEWHHLADGVGGCLVGGEYCYDEQCGGEGCCFDEDEEWITYLSQRPEELASFLITQLSDTVQSKVHVCPFFQASKGELAVYVLQRIYQKNWYELDEKYAKYNDGTLASGKDFYSLQNELQAELRSKDGLALLEMRWNEVILNHETHD